MIHSLNAGFRHALRHWKIVLYIFIVQFVAAAVVGYLMEKDLSAELGQTISGQIFNEGFNYTILKDMLRDAPDALSNVTNGLQIVILLFFIISIFLQGGAIKSLITNDSTLRSYSKHAAKYFLPFLGLGFIFLLLFIAISGILWVPLLMSALPLVESLESDKIYIWILGAVLCIYILIISFLVNWSINSRINYAVVNKTIWSSFKAGFKWTQEKYGALLLSFIFFMFLGFSVLYINVKLEDVNAIFFVFILSLVMVWIRIFLRLWYYASLCRFSSAISEA